MLNQCASLLKFSMGRTTNVSKNNKEILYNNVEYFSSNKRWVASKNKPYLSIHTIPYLSKSFICSCDLVNKYEKCIAFDKRNKFFVLSLPQDKKHCIKAWLPCTGLCAGW